MRYIYAEGWKVEDIIRCVQNTTFYYELFKKRDIWMRLFIRSSLNWVKLCHLFCAKRRPEQLQTISNLITLIYKTFQ